MRRILNDEEFIRGNVPMTKKDIRLMILAKLGLSKDSVLVDFGAGTGSISIQASLDTDCKIIAVEQKEEGIGLIRENIDKFCPNAAIECVKDRNEHCVEDLLKRHPMTHVFVGGSEGSLHNIINECVKEVTRRKENGNGKPIRMVISAISLETISDFSNIEETYGEAIANFELISMTVATAKKVGSHHLMIGENPVYICSFDIL